MSQSSISHRPFRRNQGSPTVLILPGASLMQIETLAPGVIRATCPGCGASHVFRTRVGSDGRTAREDFEHEHDSCPVLIQINDALAAVRLAALTDPDLLAAVDELCPTAQSTLSPNPPPKGH